MLKQEINNKIDVASNKQEIVNLKKNQVLWKKTIEKCKRKIKVYENKVKEMFNATSRCIPFAQIKIDDKCAICGKEAKYLILFAKAY